MAEMYNVLPSKASFWIRNQDKGGGKTCGNTNSIKNKKCEDCRMKRDKGVTAFNEQTRAIGKLKKVEGIVEYWEYIDEDV